MIGLLSAARGRLAAVLASADSAAPVTSFAAGSHLAAFASCACSATR